MERKIFLYFSMIFCLIALSITHAEWKQIGANPESKKPDVRIISHNQSEYIVEVNIFGFESNDVQINNNTYKKITLPGYHTSGETGKPELPSIIETLCLPEQADVDISIIDSTVTFFKNYLIYPRQKITPENTQKEFSIDKEFYKKDLFYPVEMAKNDNKGIWRNLYVRTLRICPIKYNPAKKELKVYNRLVLKLKYMDGMGNFIVNKNISPEWDIIYREKILNYPLINNNSITTYIATSSAYKYLVITADDFALNIKPFADYKTRQGLLSKVYTLSQVKTEMNAININYTVIRDFIKREYKNNQIEYVLLVGDVSYIPMASYYFSNDTYNYVGDYSYTCMSLLENNPIFQSSDFYSSLGIGRVSAISGAEVDNFVSKTLSYETNPPVDNTWAHNSLFISYPNENEYLFQTFKKI